MSSDAVWQQVTLRWFFSFCNSTPSRHAYILLQAMPSERPVLLTHLWFWLTICMPLLARPLPQSDRNAGRQSYNSMLTEKKQGDNPLQGLTKSHLVFWLVLQRGTSFSWVRFCYMQATVVAFHSVSEWIWVVSPLFEITSLLFLCVPW